MTKISIIMPVYNAEKSLNKSINSILTQSMKDWELLLINDGSTDSSPNLCDYFKSKDSRIKVFHKKNEGVSTARQIGINNASGKYSIHVDADDWTESTMLEELYNKAIKENADIVIADYFINSDKKQIFCKQEPVSLQSNDVLSDILNNKLFGALWNKLIKTDLYKKYNAQFFHGINYCEDVLIWAQLLQYSNLRISYYPKAFYHYYINPTSITHNFTRNTYEIRIKFRDKLQELLKYPNASEIIENVSFGIFIEAFIYNVLSKEEINKGIKLYKRQINQLKSIKWKLGFKLLSIGLTNTAHKLIHY